MNAQLNKYQKPKSLSTTRRWSKVLILIFASMVLLLQSCSKSSAGGTTGGNPLDSSLPQKISVDAE